MFHPSISTPSDAYVNRVGTPQFSFRPGYAVSVGWWVVIPAACRGPALPELLRRIELVPAPASGLLVCTVAYMACSASSLGHVSLGCDLAEPEVFYKADHLRRRVKPFAAFDQMVNASALELVFIAAGSWLVMQNGVCFQFPHSLLGP